MPFKHGKSALILFNGANLSSFFNSADFSVEVETADVSTFGSNNWKAAIAGQASASASFSGFYDPLSTTIPDALTADNGILTYCPAGGAAIGDLARMLPITSTSYGESSEIGDAVAVSWEAMAQGNVAFGQVLHPLAEDTNTTTGATKDDAAATATGWTAHLHVTAVDAGGGSWSIKLQDSADNAAWLDVSSATFTAATGVTSERLRSLTSTAALRRYVRYVATRTGGIAGDGVTFALAYSRTY